MAEIKIKFKTLLEKLKKVKHIGIYLAVGIGLVLVLIYLSLLPKEESKDETIDNTRTEFSTSGEYIEYLENKLENVITSVKGVGQAEVILTLEKGFEYIYQTEEETKTTSNGTSITSTNVVLVDGKPVIKEEIYPIIKGVVVVAEGCEDVSVKLNILTILQTVIEIDSAKINIMSAK